MPPRANRSAAACKQCKRTWGTHPCRRGGQDVTVKQKGSYAKCTNCFYFLKSSSKYGEMKADELQQQLDDEAGFDEYMNDLGDWEHNRAQGKRVKGETTTTVAAESACGVSTRKLQGYLWPKPLLEQHNEGHLLKKGKVTSINHMGKMLTGLLREKWALGAIEVYEDSSNKAVRTHKVQEAFDDEMEGANTAFNNLSSQLQAQASSSTGEGEGEPGSLHLKGPKRKAEEDNDMYDLWGVSSIFGSSGAASFGGRKEGDDVEPEQKKKAKKIRQNKALPASVGDGGGSLDTAETSSSAGGTASKSFQAAWMFSGNLSGAKKGKGNEQSREFEATEKAIQSVETVKNHVQKPDAFLSLTFQKAQSALDKISARNTEPYQKMYREACMGEHGQHAIDLLRRTSTAEAQAKAICNFVAALRDGEASAETLKVAMAEAAEEGVQLPKCAEKICHARKMNELSKKGDWLTYFTALDPAKDLATIFEGSDVSDLLDFQATSLTSTMILSLIHKPSSPYFHQRYEQEFLLK